MLFRSYSMAGGMLSLLVMAFLQKTNWFSLIGVSIAGGVCHNIGQLVVAAIVVETFSVTYYIPYLLLAGMVTGMVIGFTADKMLEHLKTIKLA